MTGPMSEPIADNLFCPVCMAVEPSSEIPESQRYALDRMTVKSGLMACYRHVDLVPDRDNVLADTIRAAVAVESGGAARDLGSYHRWLREREGPFGRGWGAP